MIRALPDVQGVLQLENLHELRGFRHGFATRRARLEDALPSPVARLHQVHGAEVRRVPSEAEARRPFFERRIDDRPDADALTTDAPDTTVAVAVADCLPLLIADPEARAAAAVHAGWRGLAAGVVENTVAAMVSDYGSDPENLIVGIGPSIGPCCFEVGPEVIAAFAERGYEAAVRVPGPAGARPHANLAAVAAAILGRLGVPTAHVADAALCTMCNSDWLWSYRRDGEHAGRMICGIALVS
jgi:YfiH family protein